MRTAFFTGLLLFAACELGEKVDPALIPERPTYAENIAPIMATYCTACHDIDGPLGAIEGVDLSSYEGVVAEFRKVRLEIEAESMPPSGEGLSGLEKAILERWEEQGFPP